VAFELAFQLNVRSVDTPVAPLDGDRFDGVPGVGHGIVTSTVKELDQGERTDVCVAHLACVLTWNFPDEVQALEAVVVPAASHPEFVPSPQSKKY